MRGGRPGSVGDGWFQGDLDPAIMELSDLFADLLWAQLGFQGHYRGVSLPTERGGEGQEQTALQMTPPCPLCLSALICEMGIIGRSLFIALQG